MAMQFVLTKPLLSMVPLVFWLMGGDYDSHAPLTAGKPSHPKSDRIHSYILVNVYSCIYTRKHTLAYCGVIEKRLLLLSLEVLYS